MLEKMNLLGAIVAIAFFVSASLVFIFMLLKEPEYGHWIGYFEFLLAIPLILLLWTAPKLQRPTLYYIQIGCMLAWLVVVALLDNHLKIDFRNTRWMIISYVVLFFYWIGWNVGCGVNRRAQLEYYGDCPILDHGSANVRATRRNRNVARFDEVFL